MTYHVVSVNHIMKLDKVAIAPGPDITLYGLKT